MKALPPFLLFIVLAVIVLFVIEKNKTQKTLEGNSTLVNSNNHLELNKFLYDSQIDTKEKLSNISSNADPNFINQSFDI